MGKGGKDEGGRLKNFPLCDLPWLCERKKNIETRKRSRVVIAILRFTKLVKRELPNIINFMP